MDQAARDSLAGLEHRRLQLEESITKLRQALRHWQTWEAEYEGLKEEIEGFDGEPTPQDLIEIGTNSGGDLVNENEIKQLVGIDKGIHRSRRQVVDLISRRVDYVQQNVRTVQKQLDAAEHRLDQVLVVSQPEMTDENGLPLAEIREELDEEGNIISSTVSNPTESQARVIEALHKAGVTDVEELAETRERPPSGLNATSAVAQQADDKTEPSAKRPRKSVAFAEEVQVAPSAPKPGARQQATGMNRADNDLANGRFKPGSKVIELNEDDEQIGSVTIPGDESPEDAALRREMLEYSFSEVGAVVAELDIDETDSQYSEFDEDEGDVEFGSEAEEEEDQYGRSMRPQISDGYRKQMMELEKKLNARMLENVGPRSEQDALNGYADDARRLVIREGNAEPEPHSSTKAGRPASRGVRFADSLDISPAPEPAPKPVPSPPAEALPSKPAVSDAVLERNTAPQPSAPEESKPRKPSRFRSAREESATAPRQPPPTVPVHLTSALSAPKPIPSGPSGRTLSSAVIERSAADASAEPPEPDGLDPALLQQEVAVEYHKMRNRMIQRQGGFMPSEDEAVQGPLLEERDGKVKKVSRFKAARLGASEQ